MSLNIYIGEENLPSGARLIKDVDKFFITVPLEVDDFSRKVIKDIDKGDLLDADSFIDRFGYKLWLTHCSTGSKIVLAVKYTDYTILGDEMGANCDELLLDIKDGSVYFTERECHFNVGKKDIDVIVNGEPCKNTNELYFVMEDLI